MKTIKKLQKPIEQDIHLKYRCRKCGLDHWLSFREASTKNFKIVCNCGKVFKVKQVTGCVLKYEQSKNTIKTKTEKEEIIIKENKPDEIKTETQPTVQKKIPSEILEKSVKLLLSYGFTKTEATKLVTKTYSSFPVDDYPTLVKYVLQSIGDIENGIDSTQTF